MSNNNNNRASRIRRQQALPASRPPVVEATDCRPHGCSPPVSGVMVHRYNQALQQRQAAAGAPSADPSRRGNVRQRSSPAAAQSDAQRSFLRDAVALQQRLARGLNLRPAPFPRLRGQGSSIVHPEAPAGSLGAEEGTQGERNQLQTRGVESSTLSQAQWREIEERAAARGDPTQPCAVCQESFQGVGQQVILSCSHMFHRACIASFERFLRAKQRTCPLCRKADYEKRVTDTGTRACMALAAVTVQSVVRAWLARRHFLSRLKAHYAQGLGDPGVRRRFALRELSRYTETVTRAIDEDEASLTSLFAECADALAISRQVFREPASDRQPRPSVIKTPAGEVGGDRWAHAVAQAQARGDRDCPICMGEMVYGLLPTQETADNDRDAGGGAWRGEGEGGEREAEGSRALSILDCSHVFHESCICAFEHFNIYEVQLCPVCRASYQRAAF